MIHFIEDDAQMVATVFRYNRSLSPEGPILQDIRKQLNWFCNVPCSYIPRVCNNVDHVLARLAYRKHVSAI